MDERHLLLLGVLMSQSQHGYRINEFIETNLGRISGLKRATAYALLDRLEAGGFVEMRLETVGNHPPRKMYSITPTGVERFYALLKKLLGSAERDSSAADIALMFLHHLPYDVAERLLRQRLEALQAELAQLRATPKHPHDHGVDLAVQRKIVLKEAECAWLEHTIAEFGESSSHPPFPR